MSDRAATRHFHYWFIQLVPLPIIFDSLFSLSNVAYVWQILLYEASRAWGDFFQIDSQETQK